MDIERLRKSIGQFWQTTLKGADEELPGTKSTTTKTADGVEDGSSEWGMIDDGSCAEQETYSYNSDEFETQRDQYSVGWLCALPIEQTAAKAMLDEEHPELPNPPNDNNAYTLGSVGKHNVVIVCLPKGTIGTVAAAQTAANMITTFPKLKFLLMVGVGGGVPSGFEFDDDEGTDIRLGDIVVGTPTGGFPGLVQWDMGKAEEGGFKKTGSMNRPPKFLLSRLSKLQSEHEMKGTNIPKYLEAMVAKWPRLAEKYQKTDRLEDILFPAEYSHADKPSENKGSSQSRQDDKMASLRISCRHCDRANAIKRQPRDMTVHYGGKVLCFEMEAAGLMDLPCLVIRGICDYCDSHKNKAWQEHAAAVAAAYAKELLSHVPPVEMSSQRSVWDQLPRQLRDSVGKYDIELADKLNWLDPVDYTHQQEYFLSKREDGTVNWFLDSQGYLDWRRSRGEVLFCPGIPGAGKTTLTSVVVEDISTRFSNNQSVGLVYMYFKYKQARLQDDKALLSTFLRQLATRNSIIGPVEHLYNDCNTPKEKRRPKTGELLLALREALGKLTKLFIVVDGLDECQEADGCRSSCISTLLNFKSALEPKVNLFVTSRSLPDIDEAFRFSSTLEINATDSDVRKFVEAHAPQVLSRIIETDGLEEAVTKTVVDAVDGMFLLAKLYLDMLKCKTSVRDVRRALSAFKQYKGDHESALKFAYDEILERISAQGNNYQDLAMKVISWVTFAARPLTTTELQYAIATQPGDSDFDYDGFTAADLLISVCAGLLIVDIQRQVHLAHYTAAEYFRHAKLNYFLEADSVMAATCVTYLTIITNVYGWCSPDYVVAYQQSSSVARCSPFEFASYAASTWALHSRRHTPLHSETTKFFLNTWTLEKISLFYSPVISGWFNRATMCMDPTSSTCGGDLGLHWAARAGVPEAVDMLLYRGRSLYATDDNGLTPLDYANLYAHHAISKRLKEVEFNDAARYQTKGLTPWPEATKSRSDHDCLGQHSRVGVELFDSDRLPLQQRGCKNPEAILAQGRAAYSDHEWPHTWRMPPFEKPAILHETQSTGKASTLNSRWRFAADGFVSSKPTRNSTLL